MINVSYRTFSYFIVVLRKHELSQEFIRERSIYGLVSSLDNNKIAAINHLNKVVQGRTYVRRRGSVIQFILQDHGGKIYTDSQKKHIFLKIISVIYNSGSK